MKTNFFFIVLVLVSITKTATGQFLNDYIGLTSDSISFHSITQYDDNYIVAGNKNNRLILAEITPNGFYNVIKEVTIVDETVGPVAASIIQDSDGNIVVAGYRGTNSTNFEGFVLKYNFATSTVLWCQHYANPYSVFLNVIEQGISDPYLVAGQNFPGSTGEDGVLIRVNRTTGAFNVINNINIASLSDTYYSLIKRGKNIFAISRLTFSGGVSSMRPALFKLSTLGTIISNQYYMRINTSTARLYGTDMTYLSSKIYSAVWGDFYGTQLYDNLYLTSSDLNTNLNWSVRYNILDSDTLEGRWNTINNNSVDQLACLGSLYDTTNDDGSDDLGDLMLMNTNTNGGVSWFKSYPLEINEREGHSDAMLIKNDSIWVVGYRYRSDLDRFVGSVLKTSLSTGELFDCDIDLNWDTININNYESNFTPSSVSLTLAPTNIIEETDPLQLDFESICNDTARLQFTEEPSTFNIVSIYPNPASSFVIFQTPKESKEVTSVEIFNSENKMVDKFEFSQQYTLAFDTYPSGVYYIKCTNQSFTEFYKIIKL